MSLCSLCKKFFVDTTQEIVAKSRLSSLKPSSATTGIESATLPPIIQWEDYTVCQILANQWDFSIPKINDRKDFVEQVWSMSAQNSAFRALFSKDISGKINSNKDSLAFMLIENYCRLLAETKLRVKNSPWLEVSLVSRADPYARFKNKIRIIRIIYTENKIRS